MAEAAGGGLAAVRAVRGAKPRAGNASRGMGKSNKKKARKAAAKSSKEEDDEADEAGVEDEKARVKDPCMRGVSLGQLLDFFVQECGDVVLEDSVRTHWQIPHCLATQLSRRCVQVNKSRRTDISEGKTRELVPNMYAVDEIAISPKCSKECMSMAELWNPLGLLIRIFVSHSWSQNFGEFVQSLYRFALNMVTENNAGLTSQECHSRAREMTLYIWAFSNNRWKAEGVKRLEKSLFYKVLQADSTWHVLMSIDQRACVLQRAWCNIEFYFATELESSVIFGTSLGPLQEIELQNKSEEHWMLELLQLLQEVDADTAQASRRSDLDMIQARIKTIDGAETSSGSSVLNGSLKAFTANTMVHHLAKAGYQEALRLALDCSADPNCQDLHYIRPLSYAAAKHGAESQVAKLLLSRGADKLALQLAGDVSNLFSHDNGQRESAIANVRQLSGAEKEFHANSLMMAERANAERAVNRQANTLVSSNSQTRLDALCAISNLGPAAAPAVASRLGDPEVAVREEAEKVLENIDDVSSAASNLARLIKHEDNDVRKRCVGWLGECGGEAEYFAVDIASMLTDVDVEVVAAAKQSLVSLGEYAADAFSFIAPLLRHQELHVRRSVAEILRNSELDSWTHMIRKASDLSALLMDTVEEVRALVVKALGSFDWNASKVLPIIVEKLSDGQDDVRLAAQKAFETLGTLGVDAASDVAKLLSHENLNIRRTASEVMLSIEWPQSEQAVKVAKSFNFTKLLVDDNEEIRKLATDALELLGDSMADVAPQVVVLIADPNPLARQQGLETLAFYTRLSAGAGPPLAKLLKHEEGPVRLCALQQLSELGEMASKHATALVQLLADPDMDVRAGVVVAFEKLDEHVASAAPKIAKLLKHDDGEVRMSAAKVLRQMGDAEGEPGAPYSKQIAKALGEDVSEDEKEEGDKEEVEEEEAEEEEDEKEDEDEKDDDDEVEEDEKDDDDEEDEEDDEDDDDSGDEEPAEAREESEAVEAGAAVEGSATDAAAVGAAAGESKKAKAKKKSKKASKATGKKAKKKEETPS